LLSVWSGLNLLLAVASNIAICLFGTNSPGLMLMVDEADLRQLDPKWLACINGLAVFCNAWDAAFCLLVLVITWTGLVKKARWAFWGLLIALAFLQTFAFVAYSTFEIMPLRANIAAVNLFANIFSTALLLAGLGMSGYAIHRHPGARAGTSEAAEASTAVKIAKEILKSPETTDGHE
jgi:hypothetical protein